MKKKSNHTKENQNSKFPDKSGFSIPNGYFDAIDTIIYSKLIEENLPIYNGFKIPENYFDHFEDNIISKIKIHKKEIIPLKRKIIDLIPVAAAVIIILFIGINFIVTQESELSSDEIINWFDNNTNAISDDEIIAVLTDEEINEISQLNTIIDDVSIEKYINENDTYLLIEESNLNLNKFY